MTTQGAEGYKEPSLSATNLAIHHHLNCDLYLHNSYHRFDNSKRRRSSGVNADATELTKAQFQRGNEWERALFAWLDAEGLLLRVRSSGPLGPSEIRDIIELDERNHFFISGIYFWPPYSAFSKRFSANGFKPVKFGIAKPDLIEVKRLNGKFQWQVIDAKASKNIKTSHFVQIYFYHLCLEQILSNDWYSPIGKASVWIAPDTTIGENTTFVPSFDGLRSTSTSLLALTLDSFIFKKLPLVLQDRRDNAAWHYNPLCKGCPFESDCGARAEREGVLGVVPNLSIADAEVLKSVLTLTRNRHPNARHLPDIEELANLVRPGGDLPNLQVTHPALAKKAKRILHLPERVTIMGKVGSPVVNAVVEKTIKVIEKRNYTLPNREDIAVIISLIIDPSTNGVAYFCISVFSSVDFFSYPRMESAFTARELVKALSIILQRILALKTNPAHAKTTTQFYVYSIAERAALQQLLVQAALTVDPLDDALSAKIRLCIGALCEGASVLSTTFQPMILSGAMLGYLGKKGTLTRSELLRCVERLGISYSSNWHDELLRQNIETELERLKAEGGRSSNSNTSEEQHRNEVGQLLRVVALEKEVKSTLALPIPGYWDLRRCHASLLPDAAACPSDDSIYAAYRREDDVLLDDLLKDRNQALYDLLREIRKRTSANDTKGDILVNQARVLSSNFMDLCKQDDLRKLFFMHQFEVLAKLNELWQTRITGCPDAVILQYRYTHRSPSGQYQHYFEVVSGSVDMTLDKERSFFNYILTEDVDDIDIPAEALFDDLGVFNCVFPLTRVNQFRWQCQAKKVRESVFVADITDLRMQQDKTVVVAKTFGDFSLRLKKWAYYRLSPRLVDFNLTKVLSTLLEMDLRTPSHPGFVSMPPFLQVCSDPRGFALQSSSSLSELTKDMLEKEKAIHSALSELHRLDVGGASNLLLKSSQRRALQRVLTHRLAIIWGPPGTGKTYTISLTLLRLLEIRSRCKTVTRYIVFVSALTHAAIEACLAKLGQLMLHYRGIPAWPLTWLNGLKLEHIKAGATHGLPEDGLDYIYAGTVFQLYNFSKRMKCEVDCVVIDEAGQLALGYASLALRALSSDGRVIVAGDSEQLAPILTSQYPQLESRLFGSILDCLMHKSKPASIENEPTEIISDSELDSHATISYISTIVQLTENFRLNRDMGEFIQTIYSKSFQPQKKHTRRLADILENIGEISDDEESDIVRDAHAILSDLSLAMSRRKQYLFEPPKLRAANKPPSLLSSESSELPRLISLALIRLRVTMRHPEAIGYETHVQGEARFAAALVNFIRKAAPKERIFVATPHRIQRHAVKEALQSSVNDLEEAFGGLKIEVEKVTNDRNDSNDGGVIVDTIERLQGSEAAFVICLFSSTYATGTSIGSLDFLLERRRLNVAISRTRALCILISSDEVLRPSVGILTNPQSAKGFAFLKAYEDRAWTAEVSIDLDKVRYQ